MNTLPRSVIYKDREGKILYHKHPKAYGKEVDGYSNVEKRIIAIRKGVSSKRAAEILLHELIHQSLEPLILDNRAPGLDIEEIIVDTISANLAEIWAKNPTVLGWIGLNLISEDSG